MVLLAALVGLVKFDPLFWWAGRLWGERVIALLGGRRNRGAKYMGRVHRWGRKFTWPAMIISPFLPIPSAIIFVIAGWAGMRLLTFIILDIIGSLLWAGMLVGLGYELGHHAVVVAQKISHYGLWISTRADRGRHLFPGALPAPHDARRPARPAPPTRPALPVKPPPSARTRARPAMIVRRRAPELTPNGPRCAAGGLRRRGGSGQGLDWRTTRRQGTVRVPCAGSPAMAASSISAATRPTSSRHMSTLVSGGWAPSAIGSQLSKPTSATSPGMARPAARSVSATPRAIWSLPQKIASVSGSSASS